MLRDRRSLISMIVVPTLVMPGLIGLMAFLSLRVAREAASATPTVMILGGEDSPRVVAALRSGLKVELVPSAPDWRTRIADKRLRAALEIPPGFDRAVEQGGKIGVRIYHHAGEMRSSFAARVSSRWTGREPRPWRASHCRAQACRSWAPPARGWRVRWLTTTQCAPARAAAARKSAAPAMRVASTMPGP